MTIEVLGFEGCPNTPVLRQAVEEAVASLGGQFVVRYVDQDALAADDVRRSWPAPTVLVNGSDLFGLASAGAGPGCRMYAGGVPTAERVTRALEARLRR